jgi:tRNA 5-methylaminomethyl-2-thiouridine biosynthesis bifunctional protein
MRPPRVEPASWRQDPADESAATTGHNRAQAAADLEAQARVVFLDGNGLPQRWARRRQFTVLETGFGIGLNFLTTWAAWCADPLRPARLCFVGVERHPLGRDDLVRAWRARGLDSALPAGNGSPGAAMASGPLASGDAARRAALLAAWPVLTPDLHRLAFDGGGVELWLALGDARDWLPRLELQAHALFLDGCATGHGQTAWDRDLARGLARVAAPDATLAARGCEPGLRASLESAGFVTRVMANAGSGLSITVGERHPAAAAPADARARPEAAEPPRRHACVIGAGLAGCAAAVALVRLGWTVEMLDEAPTLAAGASGNPAGIFHGTVHPEDSPHARWNRAASLAAAREYAQLVSAAGVPGSVDGLLRLERELPVDQMRDRLDRLGLPSTHVQALDAGLAEAWVGVAGIGAGWSMHQAGWVVPAAVCAAWLRQAAGAWTFRGAVEAARIERDGRTWHVLDRSGHRVADAPVVVVAAAARSTDLLAPHSDAASWPAGVVRGQVSWLDRRLARQTGPGRPVAGAGYAVSLPGGTLVFGATAQPGDFDPTARLADARFNLGRLASLGLVDAVSAERDVADWQASGALKHRTAWRWTLVDRLPLVGPVVAHDAAAPGSAVNRRGATRSASLRALTRVPGLFVIGGLGSRGLTWAPLAGALLAARIEGGPWPVERPLADRIDPGRFARARMQAAGPNRVG